MRAAYNRAQRLAERRIMMQAGSDYLDTLRKGNEKVSGFQSRSQNQSP